MTLEPKMIKQWLSEAPEDEPHEYIAKEAYISGVRKGIEIYHKFMMEEIRK